MLLKTGWYGNAYDVTPHVAPDTYAEKQFVEITYRGEVVLVPMRGSRVSIGARRECLWRPTPFNYSYHFAKWLGERIAKRMFRTGERVICLHGNKDIGDYYTRRFAGRVFMEELNHFFQFKLDELNGVKHSTRCEHSKCQMVSYNTLIFAVADTKEQLDAACILAWELGDTYDPR
jgi:hypothetical protein